MRKSARGPFVHDKNYTSKDDHFSSSIQNVKKNILNQNGVFTRGVLHILICSFEFHKI